MAHSVEIIHKVKGKGKRGPYSEGA